MRRVMKKPLRLASKSKKWAEAQIDSKIRARAKREGIKQLRQTNIRNDLLLLPSAGEQMIFRVSDDLNFSRIKKETFNLFTDYLENKMRIQWWSLGQSCGSSTVNILSTDRESFFKFLSGRSELAHWYFQEVKSNGRVAGKPVLLSMINPLRKYGSVRIYERVTFDAGSSFRTGSREGVEINFWDEGFNYPDHRVDIVDQGVPVVRPALWNPYAVTLPNPSCDKNGFETALKLAQSALNTDVDFEIDAVYTWVDGSDSNWQNVKANVLHVEDSEHFVDQALSDARFADHDELRYSLRSIDQFAPWIRKIWIVTAGQTPAWLDTNNPRVQIVDHRDIWPDEKGLPNYNSHAIESNLHRIPGLSKNYLYFNDDFLLTRPIDPKLFYHGNGISKVFFSKAMVDHAPISEIDNASSIAAKNAREQLMSAGYKSLSRKFFHAPSALNVDVVFEAERQFPEAFEITRLAQVRQSTDIAAAGSFYFHYALSVGKAVPGTIKYDYIDPATLDGRKRMENIVSKRDKDCIVINDGSSPENELQRVETDIFIRRSLAELLPVRSEFEI